MAEEERSFLVYTWETVAGVYRVKARDRSDAEIKCEKVETLRSGLCDSSVEQLDYDCFDVEVRDVKNDTQ